jgi:hypothetical protein
VERIVADAGQQGIKPVAHRLRTIGARRDLACEPPQRIVGKAAPLGGKPGGNRGNRLGDLRIGGVAGIDRIRLVEIADFRFSLHAVGRHRAALCDDRGHRHVVRLRVDRRQAEHAVADADRLRRVAELR